MRIFLNTLTNIYTLMVPDIHGLGVDLQSDIITLEKNLNKNCLIMFDGRRNAARYSKKTCQDLNSEDIRKLLIT